MKSILENINKIFENRVRLALMSILMVNDEAEFNALKQMLDLTDGNLAAHIATLERNHYVSVRKEYKGRKPSTTYSATPEGKRAFTEHLNALEKIINNIH
ncbi:MAG: transcriptional regulator [Ignavibacteria bacterium]|nr:MAG: transcriptional regulator [Ignavibacteria bacterium]